MGLSILPVAHTIWLLCNYIWICPAPDLKAAVVSQTLCFWSTEASGPVGLSKCRNWQRTPTSLSNNGVKCRSSCDVISSLCIAHRFLIKKNTSIWKKPSSWRCNFSYHPLNQDCHTHGLLLQLNWEFIFSEHSNICFLLKQRLPHPGAIGASHC